MDMGNEVFINSPERIHSRGLVGQLALSLMAKSYRVGGRGEGGSTGEMHTCPLPAPMTQKWPQVCEDGLLLPQDSRWQPGGQSPLG